MKRRIVSVLLVFVLIFSSVSAFAAPQVKKVRVSSLINPETIALMVGDKIEMPKTVIANMSDGTKKNVSVMWIPRRLSSNVPGIRFAIGFVNNYFGITFLKVVIAAQNIPVASVTLDKSTLNLVAGGTAATLTATVNPANATNKAVTWSSSNPAVATVVNGTVTPLAAGTATITVTTADGNFTATSLVTVSPVPIATLVSISITAPANKLIYTVGDVLDITGMVVTGTYSDSSTKVETITVANVTGFNSSTAVASQILTVTVGGKTATYSVEIKAAAVVVSVTSVSLDKEILNLVAGGPVTILTATVNPANATNKSLTWSSSNPAVAKVEDGSVTPLTAGTTTITVTTVDGNFTYISLVTVVEPVDIDKFTAADISVSQPDSPDYVRFTFKLPAGKELEGATADNYGNYSIDGAEIQSATLNGKVGNEQSVDVKLIKNSNTFTGVRNITVKNVTIKGSTAVMDPVLINNVSLNENVVPTVIKSIIKSENKITLVVSELVIANNDRQDVFKLYIGSSNVPIDIGNQVFNVVPTDEIVLTPITPLTLTQLSQGIIIRMDKSKVIIKDLATNVLDFTSIQAEFE